LGGTLSKRSKLSNIGLAILGVIGVFILGDLTRRMGDARRLERDARMLGTQVQALEEWKETLKAFGFQGEAVVRAFRDLGSQGLLVMMVDSLRLFLILGNVAALGAGIVLCLRPSLLKGVEAWADRSYTTRDSTRTLDEMRFQPDRWVGKHPKLAGALAAAGSAYILLNLGILPML